MSDFPLVVILLTYQRTEYALRTIRSARDHLRYDGEIVWVIGDDGSDAAHVMTVAEAVPPAQLYHVESKRRGYGQMANDAWAKSGELSPITLWLEDDWELKRPLHITPYVNLLHQRQDVGLLRLGYLPIDLNLRSVGWNGRMYLNVKKDCQYAFSGNPHLRHVRFSQYGQYPTGRNPGETEIAYDHQVRSAEGPAIWWPLAIGDDPYWAHIGEVQSYG